MGFSSGSSKSSSSNKAYNFLNNTYAPQTQAGVGASGMAGDLLGVNGATSDQTQGAFKNYLNSSGYKFALDSGSQAITDNAAAKGLLNSGSTLQSLTQYGQGLGQQYFQSFLQNLLGLSNNGLQAGNLIGQAGQTSSAKSSQFGFSF